MIEVTQEGREALAALYEAIAAWNRRTHLTAFKAQEEVERLKLDVAAQECLQDSAYRAGMKHGWNCAVTDSREDYDRAMAGTEHIAELRRIREARAALAGKAEQ